MILGFSTQINNKPTYFVEKIWSAIEDQFKLDGKYFFPDIYYECLDKGFVNMEPMLSKLHTIREDKADRWKAGRMIDFFINVRKKDMFQFAPKIAVVSTQKFEIKWFSLFDKKLARVFINDKTFASVKWDSSITAPVMTGKILELAQNDGFDTIDQFFKYFNQDFKGKIIHWTDKKY